MEVIQAEAEEALFNHFRNRWFINDSMEFHILLSSKDIGTRLETLVPCTGLNEAANQLERNTGIRVTAITSKSQPYQLFSVAGESHEGEFQIPRSIHRVAKSWEDEILHPGLICELNSKLETTIRFYAADQDSLMLKLLPLTTDRMAMILEDERLTQCRPPACTAGFVLAGSFTIRLGTLVSLWREGKAIRSCPACGGPAFVFRVGSGLSSGVTRAICSQCHRTVRTRESGPGIFSIISEESRKLAISRFRPYRFDTVLRVLEKIE